jgi:hypothetical protein
MYIINLKILLAACGHHGELFCKNTRQKNSDKPGSSLLLTIVIKKPLLCPWQRAAFFAQGAVEPQAVGLSLEPSGQAAGHWAKPWATGPCLGPSGYALGH